MKHIQLIEEWRKCFNLPVNTQFTIPSDSDFKAHCDHIREEAKELLTAFKENNHNQILDGIGDLWWVTVSLNMLLGIPAHNLVEKDYQHHWSEDFSNLSEHYVENNIRIINERLTEFIWVFTVYTKANEHIQDLINLQSVEAMLWSLNRYVIHLINYLQIDLEKLIHLIYDSNMSKLCNTQEKALESVEYLKEKGIVVKEKLSGFALENNLPCWYICEYNGRIKKPKTFVEPKLELY